MMRPRVDEILKPLKPFQRRTVDHAFHRLFTAQDSTSRFLVADEVGLGKTLVARGIIARTIDYLWNDVKRIDIIYICSNGSIARANLPKLRIDGASERSFERATRLTMLATELAPREDGADPVGRLNFVSFTPGTSFNMGNSGGRWQEREVLFHLLEPHVSQRTALMNLLQGRVALRKEWRKGLKAKPPIKQEIRERFDTAFKDRDDLQRKMDELFDKWFHRYRQHWPHEARRAQNDLIGKLRRLLAEVCVQALEPDLVILDEFQRFKPLLETREEYRGPDAELAQSLFQARAHDHCPVRTLLLSATPYKLYTADAELEQEDHYEDFLATTRFLLGDEESRVENLKHRLARFGTALKRAATDSRVSVEEVTSAKREVEDSLRAIMARTERVIASEDHDAMLIEHQPPVTLTPTDVRQYLAADAVFRAVGGHDPMPFWKSAPYLVHFMHAYKVNDRLNNMLEQSPADVAKVLRRYRRAFLSAQTVQEWLKLDPAHAKLRDMVREQLDRGLWRLLWIPPTLPYWPLEGAFAGQDGATKTLLFSAWNVVPDVVSAILSYEAERRMVAGRLNSYQDPAKQQVPLLRLTQSVTGHRSRHRLFLLLMPCLSLADQAHPLDAPAGYDRREWVRSRIEGLLADAGLPNPQDGEIDDRWEWAVPLLLDRGLRPFLRAWRDGALEGVSDDRDLPKPTPELFDLYLNDLLTLQPDELGRRPPGLVDLLTEVALGSPAILALRCLGTPTGVGDDTRRRFGVLIADAFWSLFNQPAVIALIRQLAAETGASRDEGVYWRRVLNYCQQGNLQAVLDEQWHLLWEQHTWSEGVEPNEIASECTKMLVQVVHPARSRIHARFFEVQGRSAVTPEEVRIRTVFALRFGHLPTEGDKSISQDAVRAAFNSPFRPFVLTSTSIGQEGLDFHPWCHRLVHWNLPGNPVDLEQREGRIHRYKGHAIRRNVAAAHGDAAFASRQPGQDLWTLIFQRAEQAARDAGASDLVPHWIAPGDCYVQRHVPLLPYTKEVEAFERLKRQLAIYRMVFGQPRQEELIALLDQGGMSVSELQALTIDLSPPPTGTVMAADSGAHSGRVGYGAGGRR